MAHTRSMSYADLVRSRRMTRRFADSPQVPKPLVSELVDLASRAPSACNTPGGDYLVLQTRSERAAFWRAASPAGAESAWLSGVSAAPTLIVCLSNEGTLHRRRYAERTRPRAAAASLRSRTGRFPIGTPTRRDGGDDDFARRGRRGAGGALLWCSRAGTCPRPAGIPGIPADRGIVGVIALGHEQRRVPSPSLARPRRRGPDVLHWGAFGVSAGEDAVARETMPSETMPVPAEGG